MRVLIQDLLPYPSNYTHVMTLNIQLSKVLSHQRNATQDMLTANLARHCTLRLVPNSKQPPFYTGRAVE